uniref:NADH-ubiquinone oxidoreductase chain 2 n=2 Tax=Sergestidae TaxID=111522 RepID=A0A348AW16_9EUCA|nr:NADH dehydrogenase subunit 2 [Sergia lucens]BBC69452.1 NADH dehydrogenase subunit 2 [Sergia lucens]
MLLSSPQLLFLSTLLLGTILSISSSSWFGAWVGLELNLLSFIPLISSKNNQYSSESALKYFLIQALGSSIIILSASFFLMSLSSASLFLVASLLLKAGAAPFHFWFPSVMEGLNWPQAITLMTVQKIAPMSLISYTISYSSSFLMTGSILLSALVGAIGGLNQTFLRKIMAYSSINHMSWMLSAIMLSESSWMVYFMIYSIVSSSLAFLFYSHQSFHISHIMNHSSHSQTVKILTFISLLSLGGLPPFTGFIAKWFIIQELAFNQMFITLLVLLSSALLTLFYYLRIAMTSMMLSSPKSKWMKSNKFNSSFITPFLIFINSAGIFTPSIIALII